jgi:hypothetical protein
LTGLKLPLLSQLKAKSYNVWTSNISNNIHAVSQIEEQRRRMKYNEENNPNLLFMLFYVLFITICALNNHFEYKNVKNN